MTFRCLWDAKPTKSDWDFPNVYHIFYCLRNDLKPKGLVCASHWPSFPCMCIYGWKMSYVKLRGHSKEILIFWGSHISKVSAAGAWVGYRGQYIIKTGEHPYCTCQIRCWWPFLDNVVIDSTGGGLGNGKNIFQYGVE